MAVNPSASGSWCLSSELGCLFEGEVGASSLSSLYKVGVGALSLQAFVFSGTVGHSRHPKLKLASVISAEMAAASVGRLVAGETPSPAV